MDAIILPGNGGNNISDNWYLSVKKDLEKLGIIVTAENMPDPILARKQFWLPFIKKHATKDSIIICHSSGAIAILKYLEHNKCKLAIVVGVYHTDLNNEYEKKSGYFDEPWDWDSIKQNAEKIIIFASRDDPYIPISEPRFILDQVDAEYHEYGDEGHFMNTKTEFPEIVDAVKKIV